MDSRQVAGGRRCRLIKTDNADNAEIYRLLGGKEEDLHTLEHEIEDFVKNAMRKHELAIKDFITKFAAGAATKREAGSQEE